MGTEYRGAKVKAKRSVRRQKMMVTWTKVVAVEWEDSSRWVDNLDGKCEREKAMIVPRF